MQRKLVSILWQNWQRQIYYKSYLTEGKEKNLNQMTILKVQICEICTGIILLIYYKFSTPHTTGTKD